MATQDDGGVLVRPALPARFAADAKTEGGFFVLILVLVGIGVLLFVGAVAAAKDGAAAIAPILMVALGLGFIGFAVFAASKFTRAVTIDDDGFSIQGLFGQSRFSWNSVARIEFAFESMSDRYLRAAVSGGRLGVMVASALNGGMPQGEGDHRRGDPFEDGRLRQFYCADADVVVDAKPPVLVQWHLGWWCFTSLRAEAVARGVTTIVKPRVRSARPRRRRRATRAARRS